jgi:alpha,alpha-trehalose phosphorylase
VRFRGRIVHVAVRSGTAEYRVLSGPPVDIAHYGQTVRVGTETVSQEIPQATLSPEPSQPAGRRPQSRRARVLPAWSPC